MNWYTIEKGPFVDSVGFLVGKSLYHVTREEGELIFTKR